MFAAFTDHLAVCLRIKLEVPLLQRGRGLWNMNTKLLGETTYRNRFQQERIRWRLQEGKYPDRVTLWEKYVKRKIRFLFIQERTKRTREVMTNDNYYYARIYDILKDHRHPREKTVTLSHLKSKTVRLYSKRVQSLTIDTHESTLCQGESPSLFHLLQMRKRCVSRMITSIIDKDGVTQKTTSTPFLLICKANTI